MDIFFLIVLITGVIFLYVFWETKRMNGGKPILIENQPTDNKLEFPCEEFERKKFLFDSRSEFHFFKVLQEIVGDKYYIFPQVGYVHLIDETSSNFYERRKYRSMIDRKSADYVLCDKDHMIPQLVIELNGNSHSLPERIKRDDFINEIAKCVKLPILTMDVRDIENKDLVEKLIRDKVKVW